MYDVCVPSCLINQLGTVVCTELGPVGCLETHPDYPIFERLMFCKIPVNEDDLDGDAWSSLISRHVAG